MGADSVVALDTGAAVNLACSWWLERRDSILERWGAPRAETFPESARFKFGDGRLGDVRCAAGCPVGVAGGPGKCTAYLLDAGIPASSRKGASEARGRQVDSPCSVLTLRKQGVDVLSESGGMGRYVWSAASIGKRRKKSVMGPTYESSR